MTDSNGTKKPTYSELLRDPRWQRKRLEVMERADFKCQNCGAADKTLNVHHGYYAKGKMPWEYEDGSLWCYCEPCHEWAQGVLDMTHQRLAFLSPDQQIRIWAYQWAVRATTIGKGSICVRFLAVAQGIGDFFGLDPTEVDALLSRLDQTVTYHQLDQAAIRVGRKRWPIPDALKGDRRFLGHDETNAVWEVKAAAEIKAWHAARVTPPAA